ncbi:YdcF family protein [Leptospira sp. 2 VSF19]|uniref:YdcF family protein n=1 Tax=Leptospira soteropolitanensis TaxID=2950025 RepID=A0AAW5VKM5_9LEPT|nr:YdcF family protein [Leptospira soteropolitanensis]MCW7491589.1 YdcF family protein [Leptospira soteropolitanensis]MCW7499173.1 YdcF family protein [Leptospira soteropolitanensis]MCW7521235.1 YdcF family protein [Leptospira soteropolitanensis]MCW7525277.1 YdcF family protein [Leptospira soteropolitanensis]MCW7529144.1 YdcF family protein [Leptospira soteropolitanensis]
MILSHKKISDKDLESASIIWDFLTQKDNLKKADLIFVLCSHDIRIAKFASDLYKNGYANRILFSGGLNFFTKNIFPDSEADSFANFAIKEGIPSKDIIIENKSTNTGENIQFSKSLLNATNVETNSIIAIQKPSMTLRVRLAFDKQWSDIQFIVAAPNYSLLDSPHSHINLFMIINEIVGDLQRIITYPKLGFQSEIFIPESVVYAFHYLVSREYNLHLIR